MIFEQLSAGGCRSYLIGCAESCAAALIDPEVSLVDRYAGLAARNGLRIHYVIDTHTHADHFSATRTIAWRLEVPVVMHRLSPAPFVDLRLDDGEMLALGKLRVQVLHTPGHTDVRERDAYEAGHIAGAKLLPRGQLELRVNQDLPDPTRRIVSCCEFGRISTLATSTLRVMGYQRAVALDGGMKAWREAAFPLESGKER